MTNITRIHKSGSCGVGFICNVNGGRSYEIVRMGIEAVKNLTHRGAVGADGKTGDGAGVLFQIPKKFFMQETGRSGYKLSHSDNLAVGMMFLRKDIRREIEEILLEKKLKPSGWRDVPTNDDALGKSALSTKPWICQIFIDTLDLEPEKRELNLFIARREIENKLGKNVYICSMSSKTIVYKGMLVATNLDNFYPDLKNGQIESAFCLFHQRFSTNTFPDWTLAQPFRVLAHNGEINTIQGNRNWIHTIEHDIRHKLFGKYYKNLKPLVSDEESDSASLDRIIELLMHSGYSLEHAVNMCIPPACECCNFSDDNRRNTASAFFEYQSFLMKPWDGPAALVFTDGKIIGAHMDRNGLRPLRYILTEDGILIAGSEVGMTDLSNRHIKERGRLGPGDSLSVDIEKGKILNTDVIINRLSSQKPYGKWIDKFLIKLTDNKEKAPVIFSDVKSKQIAFGYTTEEIQFYLKEMAANAKEPTFSMGDDTPLPPLSKRPQILFRYFKQRFSQVTNPPIDSIRERMVMSLRMNLGYKKNFLYETPEHAQRLRLESPILLDSQMKEIEAQKILEVSRIAITFPGNNSEDSLLSAVKKLQNEVISAVRSGSVIIILSDRDISKEKLAIPGLLAISAAFQALHRERIANRVSIIIETGEARDIHHMACLIGFNASAVYPYLAYQTIKDICNKGILNIPADRALTNYKKAIEDGILKVMARMGISTLNSYYGAHLFDTVCLNRDFVEEYFTGTPVSIESDGITEIENSLRKRHSEAFDDPEPELHPGGTLKFRKGGELHAWSPFSVGALKAFNRSKDIKDYREFSQKAREYPVFIRDLLSYKKGISINLSEVESEKHILKRFFSGAMSVGALSPEAHETIAEACNRLGIKSNSGEGGENPVRYWTIKNSAIKQIASGRFGVTPAYLASAIELEIKIAQGAKPGEGGHLPAIKVTDYIAGLRYCKPNIILISPPPHHDIYSIEDLAQLINDLKEANPEAKVCVKLVSETGVGTVAAGVAKAYADIVLISGCEGGTGAASVTSIKNTGNYWETGLAETQRVLIENGLREKIRVRVDGGLRTGKDIIIAALLGAEEFGFGTAVMIATGCIMARRCHDNTCPTGIASQDERFRKRFKGKPDDVISFFRAVAWEVREILADMGFRSIDEIIGRTDLLTAIPLNNNPEAKRIKLSCFYQSQPPPGPTKCLFDRNDNPAISKNREIVNDLRTHIEKAIPVEKDYTIRNIDRSVPVTLNYLIALRYGNNGLPPDTIRLTFRGTAGQSFGAFNHKGISLTLLGEVNDYVGKGMFGGRIVIKPKSIIGSHNHVIAGNTVLYGATGGEFYAAGKAGERFAVRNSGATAVVEGTGHHLCEYMTRGTVVVVGETGYNIGAGMSGGVIYIFDEHGNINAKLNHSYATSYELEAEDDIKQLKTLLENHIKYTGSERALMILERLDTLVHHFKKIISRNYV